MTSLTFSVADVLYVGTIKDIPDERVSFRPPQLSLFMRDCAGPTKGKGHGIFQKEEKVGKNTASSQKLLLHRLLLYLLSASPLASHLISTESTDLEYIQKGKIIYRFSIVFSRSFSRPGMPCFALKMATVPFRFATNDRVDDKRQTSFRTCSFVRRSLFRSRQRENEMLWILVLRIDLSCVIGYAKTIVKKHPPSNTINNRLKTIVGI